MTQASTARVERHLNGQHLSPIIEGKAFVMPPAGMLSEQVNLTDYGLVLGLIHPEGSPILICAWDGRAMTRLLPDAAARWADEIALTPGLKPVIDAIRGLVKRAGDIAVASLMRTEGNA
jgi:hypothetical protein